jgi:DNA-directed RNA polymerase specialized sigma24 family protein
MTARGTAPVVFLTEYRDRPARLLRLLRRVAAADRVAFSRLYIALEPDVTAIVHEHLADDERAGEVTAASFLEAWQSADLHTAPGTDVAEWVTGIAARRAGEQDDPRTRSHPARQDRSPGVALEGLLGHRASRRAPFRRGPPSR